MMVDRVYVTDDFGQTPKDKRFKRRYGEVGQQRDFVCDGESRRLENILSTYLGDDTKEEREDWKLTLRIPRPAFWQKLIVDFTQWALGDRVLIIDRSRILNKEKTLKELKRLWGEREESTLSKPTVIQLQIALEDGDESPAPVQAERSLQ